MDGGKEILKIRAEINAKETKETIAKINTQGLCVKGVDSSAAS